VVFVGIGKVKKMVVMGEEAMASVLLDLWSR